jgi:hypothetical protein
MMNTEFLNGLGSSDFNSLIICLEAYQSQAFREEIEEIGFNNNSGYIWLAITNGVTIASCFGQDPVFFLFDFETGEEKEYSTYYNAINQILEDEEDI